MSNKVEATFHPYGRRIMTKAELLAEADRIENNLKETKEGMKGIKSMQADVVAIVLPMLRDQLKLIRAIAEAL